MITSTRDPETYAIIGAAMAVHRELGCGYLEAVYKAALTIELGECSIPFRSEVRLPIAYKGYRLPLGYRVDFVCFDTVLVEVKACLRSARSRTRRRSTTSAPQGRREVWS